MKLMRKKEEKKELGLNVHKRKEKRAASCR